MNLVQVICARVDKRQPSGIPAVVNPLPLFLVPRKGNGYNSLVAEVRNIVGPDLYMPSLSMMTVPGCEEIKAEPAKED